jgi:hypothetical protein
MNLECVPTRFHQLAKRGLVARLRGSQQKTLISFLGQLSHLG